MGLKKCLKLLKEFIDKGYIPSYDDKLFIEVQLEIKSLENKLNRGYYP